MKYTKIHRYTHELAEHTRKHYPPRDYEYLAKFFLETRWSYVNACRVRYIVRNYKPKLGPVKVKELLRRRWKDVEWIHDES
jgi:hypothetical protein